MLKGFNYSLVLPTDKFCSPSALAITSQKHKEGPPHPSTASQKTSPPFTSSQSSQDFTISQDLKPSPRCSRLQCSLGQHHFALIGQTISSTTPSPCNLGEGDCSTAASFLHPSPSSLCCCSSIPRLQGLSLLSRPQSCPQDQTCEQTLKESRFKITP